MLSAIGGERDLRSNFGGVEYLRRTDVQFDVLSHFQPLSSEQQEVLNAQTVDEFVGVLQTSTSDDWRKYWFNGAWGLYTYPDYPEWYWINGEWIRGNPWWARLNLIYLP